jgi:ELWxxDGT repeat protein
MVEDINPGSAYSNPFSAERFGNQVFFLADDGVSGVEPWVTDGTAAGTYRIADTSPGPGHCEGFPRGIALGDKFYFYCVSENENHGHHVSYWVTDGSVEGTTRLVGGSDPYGSTLLNFDRIGFQDRVVFTFYTAATGEEIWVTDGTSGGTTLLKDCAAGAGSFPQDFAVLGDKLLFFAYDDSFDVVLWSSDGTPDGTTILARAEHAPNHEIMQVLGEKLVFTARPSDASEPFSLWITDGTTAGTTSIADIAPFSDRHFTALGDELLFFGGPYASTDIEPWVTDGTAGGTRLVKDIVAGDMGSVRGNSSNPSLMVSLAGNAYFPAKLSYPDVQFFASDGTEEGTELLTPEGASDTPNPMGEPFLFDDMLLFTGTWNDSSIALYRYRPDASR